MKALISLLLLCTLLMSSCGIHGSRPVFSPFWESTTQASPAHEEVMLTSLSYGDYLLRDGQIPYYRRYGISSEFFTVCGVPFANGVFICPASGGEAGYIEYSIASLSERLNAFVCKVGGLDGEGSGRELISVSFLVDGKLMSRTPPLSYGQEAYLIDVVIPYGAKTLRIECRVEGNSESGGTIIGDGRFLHSQYLDQVDWPE